MVDKGAKRESTGNQYKETVRINFEKFFLEVDGAISRSDK